MKEIVAIIRIGRGRHEILAPDCFCRHCGEQVSFSRAIHHLRLCEGCGWLTGYYRALLQGRIEGVEP